MDIDLSGSAHRMMLEASPRKDVAEAISKAERRRIGRGYRATVRLSVGTACELAEHFHSIADVAERMTAEEIAGGRGEAATARHAGQDIDEAIREWRDDGKD